MSRASFAGEFSAQLKLPRMLEHTGPVDASTIFNIVLNL